jgi:hypothetical protein
MLEGISARELFQWQALWRRSPWGSEADDWRVGFVMAAMNGQAPDKNRPKWGQAAAPRFVEISFDQACRAFAR